MVTYNRSLLRQLIFGFMKFIFFGARKKLEPGVLKREHNKTNKTKRKFGRPNAQVCPIN